MEEEVQGLVSQPIHHSQPIKKESCADSAVMDMELVQDAEDWSDFEG